MDTNEMFHIVRFLADLKPHICGIYASNSLPTRVTQFPSTVLCNTEPIEEKRFSLDCFLVQKRDRM